MSENELLAMFDQSLTTLSFLTKTYDDGRYPNALLMAVEVHKLLTQGGPAMRLRSLRNFTTIDFLNDEQRMLNAMHKLVVVRIGGELPQIDFFAAFQIGEARLVTLSFKEWWNNDVIYRASAALPGSRPGWFPVNDAPSVPFQSRQAINRRDFVALFRNTRGAHQDDEMPILLEELEETRSWSGFSIGTPDGALSTDDGTLKTGASIMAAMMRQIAHQLLIAYGRDDPKDETICP
jgi:hypothetical protein